MLFRALNNVYLTHTTAVLQAFGSLGRRMPSEHYPEYLSPPDLSGADPASAVMEEQEDLDPTPADLPSVTAGGADLTSRPGKRKLSTDSSSRDAPMKMTRFADTPESGALSPAPTVPGTASAATPPAPSTSATPADTENSNLSEWAADGTTSCSERGRSEDASLATSLHTERTDDTDLSGGERRARRRRKTRRGRRAPLTETEDTRLLGLQIMPL